MKTITQWTRLALLALALGCSDGAGPLNSNVQVSFATRDPAAPRAGPFGARADTRSAAGDTLTDGNNTLIITKAEIVLRQIQFKAPEAASCDGEDPPGCEDVELGPVLVDLPLGPGAVQSFEVDLPAGTYSEVKFEIHKVTSDAQDAAFRAAHPTFPVGQSIRVQGTFNGTAFVYQTELNVEQELDLVPPLAITDTTTGTNVTIRVGLAGWFRALNGSLLDPASGNKGQPNESLVNENIKRSIEAFEDRDRDGDERDEG